MSKRIILVGAGFSKAIASAPLANEFVGPIYKKAIDNSLHIDHHGWNKCKQAFVQVINYLEKSVEHGLEFLEKNGTVIKNRSGIELIESINIEQLCTFLDININSPFIPKGVGVDLQGCPIPFIDKMYVFDLEYAQKFIKHNIIECLLPLNLNINESVHSKFAKFIKTNDIIFTFNYDLLLEQTLWKKNYGIQSMDIS